MESVLKYRLIKRQSKKLTHLTLIVLTLAYSESQRDPSSTLTVRTTGLINGLWDNSITTIYPDGTIKKVELNRLKMKDLSSNLKMVNHYLNSLTLEGYKLNLVAVGNRDGIIVTTNTLIK